MSEELFREVTGPCRVGDQRASALRFGDRASAGAVERVGDAAAAALGISQCVTCGSTSLRCWGTIPANGPRAG